MKKENKLQIRNSTAEFLIFTRQAGEDGIEVRVAEETVWLTQKLISVLFDKGRSTITEHLTNIFESGELDEKAVCRDFRHTAEDGKDYTTRFYNLDAIIAVGFRVNSARAIQFRQWATGVLRDFAIRGYVLDKERLKNGAFFSKEGHKDRGHPILFLSREKVRKNKTFKNNRFKMTAYRGNTSPFKSLRGLSNFCFDESLAHNEL